MSPQSPWCIQICHITSPTSHHPKNITRPASEPFFCVHKTPRSSKICVGIPWKLTFEPPKTDGVGCCVSFSKFFFQIPALTVPWSYSTSRPWGPGWYGIWSGLWFWGLVTFQGGEMLVSGRVFPWLFISLWGAMRFSLPHLGDPLAEVQAHFTQTVAPHFLHGPTHLGIAVSPLKSVSCFFHQP